MVKNGISAPEGATKEHIQDFLQKFKSTYLDHTVPSQKREQESSKKPQEVETLQGIIKTLAEKLKEAQKRIHLLESHNPEIERALVENGKLTAILQERQKEREAFEQEKKRLEESLQNSNVAQEIPQGVLNELSDLKFRLQEKEKIVEQLSLKREQAFEEQPFRETIAKMAISMKLLEEEVAIARCEKVVLQRELKRISERMESTEKAMKDILSQKDRLVLEQEKLRENCDQQKLFLDEEQRQRAVAEEKWKQEVDGLQKKRVSLEVESALLKNENGVLKEKIQEVEELLAEKIERLVVADEEIFGAQKDLEYLSDEKEKLSKSLQESVVTVENLRKEKSELFEKKEEVGKAFETSQALLVKMEQSIRALEAVFESSLQSSDLIRRALETISKAHNQYEKVKSEKSLSHSEEPSREGFSFHSQNRPYELF